MSKSAIVISNLAPHARKALVAHARSLGWTVEEAASWCLSAGAMLTVPASQLVARLHVISKQPTGRMRRGAYEPLPVWQEYLDIISAIARLADSAVLDDLLAYFDDGVEERTLMSEMLRAMLRVYPLPALMPAAARAAPGMCARAPETTLILHRHLIDAEDAAAFELYLAELRALEPSARVALRDILSELDASPRLDAVRAALGVSMRAGGRPRSRRAHM